MAAVARVELEKEVGLSVRKGDGRLSGEILTGAGYHETGLSWIRLDLVGRRRTLALELVTDVIDKVKTSSLQLLQGEGSGRFGILKLVGLPETGLSLFNLDSGLIGGFWGEGKPAGGRT